MFYIFKPIKSIKMLKCDDLKLPSVSKFQMVVGSLLITLVYLKAVAGIELFHVIGYLAKVH